jgi:Flp pilus assembly pilin Flp
VASIVWRFVANFAEDEQGQDLVEYVLLGAFVAIATMVGLRAIRTVLGGQYGAWDTNEQNLWEPPQPK